MRVNAGQTVLTMMEKLANFFVIWPLNLAQIRGTLGTPGVWLTPNFVHKYLWDLLDLPKFLVQSDKIWTYRDIQAIEYFFRSMTFRETAATILSFSFTHTLSFLFTQFQLPQSCNLFKHFSWKNYTSGIR